MYWRQCRLFFCELLIEIARICTAVLQTPHHRFSVQFKTKKNQRAAHNSREVRWGYTFVENVIPDDVFEEWLPFNLLRVPLSGAEAAIRVSGKKLQAINAQRYRESGKWKRTF